MDGLFDDSEPEHHDESVLDELPDIHESPAFRRYVAEGITLLEEWLRHAY